MFYCRSITVFFSSFLKDRVVNDYKGVDQTEERRKQALGALQGKKETELW